MVMQTIGEMMEEHGDLGMVAELSLAKQKTMFKPKKLQAKKVAQNKFLERSCCI